MEKTDTAAYKLRDILKQNYEEAWEAKRKGELVGWSSSVFPIEIPETLGLHIVYPENQAAAIAARGGGERMCVNSENRGYSNDLCAYARINLSYAMGDTCEEQPMPLPDYVLCCSNICSCMLKWYENLAIELNIPIITIDIPFCPDTEISQAEIQYVSGQFWNAVRQLEELTGKEWDNARFKEVMCTANRTSRAWFRATGMGGHTPSPFNGFDLLNHMAAMVTARGRIQTAEAVEQLADEYEANIENGTSTYKGEEKYRIMLEGISCWPHVRATLCELEKNGINMVTTVYVDAFSFVYDSFEGMIEAYCRQQNAIGLEASRDRRIDLCKKNAVDGLLIHTNRSCKAWTGFMNETGRQVGEACGIPVTSFDGDQADPRNFSLAQYETRVQGLAEIMEANAV